MKKTNNEGKNARIQSLILIITGFVLIFCILTATILYTVYDRSLIDFIQDFGKEEPKDPEPEPEDINPALMEHKKADQTYKENLMVISDSPLSNLSANQNISIKGNSYFNHTISPTNFTEVPLESHQYPDEKVKMGDLIADKKPGYLLLNFSNAVLNLDDIECKNFFGAILKLVKEANESTTVIISGPLPVFSNTESVNTETINRLNNILASVTGDLNKEGNRVYYLPSPSDESFCNPDGTLLSKYQDANTPGILDAQDGCWHYFNNHILQYSIPTHVETKGQK